jgi:hypothetical protein
MQAQAIKDEILELERCIGHAKAKLRAVGYDIAEISGPEMIITTSGRENLPVFRSKLTYYRAYGLFRASLPSTISRFGIASRFIRL